MTQNKHVNLLLEVLGCFVSAAGIYSFAVASGVPVTGVAGVCAILYRLFGIPMGLSNVLINIPIILFSYKVLGKSFLLRSMRCMVLFAVFTDYLLPIMPVYTGDRLLATLCGGVICGIGDALIYMQNSSTGGIDFITMAVKVKHPHLPFGNITFAAALAVIVANGLVFHDVDSIIYGLIFNFVCSAVINKMMFGFSSSMLAMIVTDDGEAACKEIDRVADRGATILQGRGGYGGAHAGKTAADHTEIDLVNDCFQCHGFSPPVSLGIQFRGEFSFTSTRVNFSRYSLGVKPVSFLNTLEK